MRKQRTKLTRALALAAVGAVALVGCGTDTTDTAASSAVESSAGESSSAAVERQSATPRVALSYDGGVLVLDAQTLEQVADIPAEGFIRLNSADNGRHVFVSESEGFRVLDMGTWTRKHGDHGHYYTSTPRLTDMRFGGAEPGHVVPHDSRITLFSDGTGEIDVVEPAELLRGNAKATSFTVEPHHGVAVHRGDGTVVVSVGNEETRSGLAILDKDRKEIARNDTCPGIHGEAAAADGVLTFGCQDGILIVTGNTIRKVDSPDDYGRIGNQAGSEKSPFVLGDYKTDKDAELERPNRFTLTDTRSGVLRVLPIATSYSFRSLERGTDGTAVILGTDGALHVIDPATGTETKKIPVIGAWSEPDEWQSPMPNLYISEGVAYVSDPAAKTLTAVNLATGEEQKKVTLDKTTIELTGVTG